MEMDASPHLRMFRLLACAMIAAVRVGGDAPRVRRHGSLEEAAQRSTGDRTLHLRQTFYGDSGCRDPAPSLEPVERVVPPTLRCLSLGRGGSVRREPPARASIVPSGLEIPAKVWEVHHYRKPFVSTTSWGVDYGPIDRSVDVFGGVITIYADVNIPDAELQHVASVAAEFLDNDEDGEVDNGELAETLRAVEATLIVHHERTPGERTGHEPRDDLFLSLHAIQTLESKIDKGWLTPNPDFVDNLSGRQPSGAYDSTLEEVWHLITDHGYGRMHLEWSREQRRDTPRLQDLMDAARGGRFDASPDAALPEDEYPAGAWFTREQACSYRCFVSEYVHWAWSALAGAQRYRTDQEYQWKLFTPAAMFETDPGVTALLKDCRYRAPRNLPNGKYTPVAGGHGRQFEFCAGGREEDTPPDPVLFLRTFASQDCTGRPTSRNTTISIGTCAPSETHAGMYEMYDYADPTGDSICRGAKNCKQCRKRCPDYDLSRCKEKFCGGGGNDSDGICDGARKCKHCKKRCPDSELSRCKEKLCSL